MELSRANAECFVCFISILNSNSKRWMNLNGIEREQTSRFIKFKEYYNCTILRIIYLLLYFIDSTVKISFQFQFVLGWLSFSLRKQNKGNEMTLVWWSKRSESRAARVHEVPFNWFDEIKLTLRAPSLPLRALLLLASLLCWFVAQLSSFIEWNSIAEGEQANQQKKMAINSHALQQPSNAGAQPKAFDWWVES